MYLTNKFVHNLSVNAGLEVITIGSRRVCKMRFHNKVFLYVYFVNLML